jgi:hypothetical protein
LNEIERAQLFRMKVLERAVERGSISYEANAKVIATLEDKAQKTAGIAGAFLAAGLAFLKPENFRHHTDASGYILGSLELATVMLIVSIGCSVSVLWVRPGPGALSFETVNELKTNFLALSPEELADDEYQESYWQTQTAVWEQAIKGQKPIMERKAHILRIGQIMLTLAMFAIAFLLVNFIHQF